MLLIVCSGGGGGCGSCGGGGREPTLRVDTEVVQAVALTGWFS